MQHISLQCPKTGESFKRPMIGPDGKNYESSVVVQQAQEMNCKTNAFYRNHALEEYIGLKQSDVSEQPPNCLHCNITFVPPSEPVICSDGRLYEKSAIQKWVRQKKKLLSPFTQCPIEATAYRAKTIAALIQKILPDHVFNSMDGTEVDISMPLSHSFTTWLIPESGEGIGANIGILIGSIAMFAAIFYNASLPAEQKVYLAGHDAGPLMIGFLCIFACIGSGLEMAIRWLVEQCNAARNFMLQPARAN